MYLEELYTSNEVYEVREDGGLSPINIINTEFLKKNKGNKDIVNIELTYVYSNNIQLLGK
jgi:phosphopantetheine adenylyltransferase